MHERVTHLRNVTAFAEHDGTLYLVVADRTPAGRAIQRLVRQDADGTQTEFRVPFENALALLADDSGVWVASTTETWRYDRSGRHARVLDHGTSYLSGGLTQDSANVYVMEYDVHGTFGLGRIVWRIPKRPFFPAAPRSGPGPSASRQIAAGDGRLFWNFQLFADTCEEGGPCQTGGGILWSDGDDEHVALRATNTISYYSPGVPIVIGGFALTDSDIFARVGDSIVRALPDAGTDEVAPCSQFGGPGQLVEAQGWLYCDVDSSNQASSAGETTGLWRVAEGGGTPQLVDGAGGYYGGLVGDDSGVWYLRDGDVWHAY